MQKYLEESILKLNYKSFTQIVILGSASFTPFMQLPSGQRRTIIEDILDIQIFTIMNQVLKDKTNTLKDTIKDLDSQLQVGQQKAKIQEQYIHTLEENKKNKIDEIELKIGELNATIQTLEGNKTTLSGKKSLLNDPQERQRKLQNYSEKFKEQLKKIRKELDFYENHNDCPTCKQGIPHDFKEEIKLQRTEKVTQLEEGKEKLEKEFTEVETMVEEYLKLSDEILSVTNDIVTSERFLQRLILEKSEAEKNVGNIDEEKSKLRTMIKEGLAIGKEKSVQNEDMHYFDIASSLLKDTGIKTRIIKKYLPVINQLVNKYLAAMDFFVHFDLDEKFGETIKSRHRDRFSYASFSEGEKQRIDLALLFTWRTIAKMKNSAATNLLVLDEVFDSSLDTNGTDYVMTLLQTIGDDANVFVISHKGDQLFDKFRGVIKFEKRQNYSVIV
jgi:DNA repair exonuclease SbcCD ATPase subunit